MLGTICRKGSVKGALLSEKDKNFYYDFDYKTLDKKKQSMFVHRNAADFTERDARAMAEGENRFARLWRTPLIDVETEVKRLMLYHLDNRIALMTELGIFPPRFIVEQAVDVVELVEGSEGTEMVFSVIDGRKPEVFEDFSIYTYAPGVLCIVDNSDRSLMAYYSGTGRVKCFKFAKIGNDVVRVDHDSGIDGGTYSELFSDEGSLVQFVKDKLRNDIEKNPGPGPNFDYFVAEKVRGPDDANTAMIHSMVSAEMCLKPGTTIEFSQDSLMADYLDSFVSKHTKLLDGGRMFCFSAYNKAEITLVCYSQLKDCEFAVSTNHLTTTYRAKIGVPAMVAMDLELPEKVSVSGSEDVMVSLRFSFVSYPVANIPERHGYYRFHETGAGAKFRNRVFEVTNIEAGTLSNFSGFKYEAIRVSLEEFGFDPRPKGNKRSKKKGHIEAIRGPTDIVIEPPKSEIKSKRKSFEKNNTSPGNGAKAVPKGEVTPTLDKGLKKKRSKTFKEEKVPPSFSGESESPLILVKSVEGDTKKKRKLNQTFSFTAFHQAVMSRGIPSDQINTTDLRQVYNAKMYDSIGLAVKAYALFMKDRSDH